VWVPSGNRNQTACAVATAPPGGQWRSPDAPCAPKICATDQLDSIDQEQLERVRRGGHEIRVLNDGAEVQVSIYRTGRAYGAWDLRCSPEGHLVHVDHLVPAEYRADGRWICLRRVEAWRFPADDWRTDPALHLSAVMPDARIARKAAPLLVLPDHVAPDAQNR
jgi:hypothetical protein